MAAKAELMPEHSGQPREHLDVHVPSHTALDTDDLHVRDPDERSGGAAAETGRRARCVELVTDPSEHRLAALRAAVRPCVPGGHGSTMTGGPCFRLNVSFTLAWYMTCYD